MSLRNFLFAGLLLGFWRATDNVVAQLPDEVTRIYTLRTNSALTDDCPICDRIPIVVPMTGTFGLRFLDQNPLSTRYQIRDISFHAGAKGGPEYWVTGSGTYQVGGEVAVFQDLFLDVAVDNGFEKTGCLASNPDPAVAKPLPDLNVTALQTNGTAAKVYSLKLVAVPALQFRAIIPDYRNNDVRLQWESDGGQAQLERAENVKGPYLPISPITTNQTFTDVGALTNGPHWYYRLHQY